VDENTLPEERRVTVAGDAPLSAEEAVEEVTIVLNPSPDGGTINLFSPRDSNGPSGVLRPDGNGGEWDDNVQRDTRSGVTREDSDEVSEVSLRDGVLSFLWTRINLDGTGWEVRVSFPVPASWAAWWEWLPASGDSAAAPGYCVEVTTTVEGDDLVVSGTTTGAPQGTVLEVFLLGTDRREVVEVGEDGKFNVTFPDAGVDESSSGTSVQVVRGSHVVSECP
jgi:hypothetical protein